MACQEYEGRLDDLEDYREGQLSDAKAAEVRAHLEVCSACREELEAAREAARLLRAAFDPVEKPASAFWVRVQAGIRAAQERQGFWGTLELFARRLVWSAALVLVLLTGYVAAQNGFRPRAVAPPASEVREIFPEPVQQPSDQEEVLLTLASRGGRER